MVSHTIKQLRKRANLTQEDVAETCGVSAMTVSRWERGIIPVPAEKVGSLASVLGVSQEDIQEFRADNGGATAEYAESRLDVFRWRNHIASSGDLSVEAKAILAALPLFLDEQSWMVLVTIDQFVGETGIDRRVIDKCWPEVLGSGRVVRVNDALEWVFWLKM